MNLFVLVGFLLVVLAAVGRAGKKKVDTGGRVLSGSCGVGLLAAATVMFLGLEKARAAPPENLTPAGSDQLRLQPGAEEPPGAGTEPTTHPLRPAGQVAPPPESAARPGPAPAGRRLLSEPVMVRWGCDEKATGRASLVLPPGARLVSAKVLLDSVVRAKAFERGKPTWDKQSRVCTGEATFQGLDRLFFNCPGGGHATMRIEAVVAGP